MWQVTCDMLHIHEVPLIPVDGEPEFKILEHFIHAKKLDRQFYFYFELLI